MGDIELQRALHKEDGEHPTPCQDTRSRSPSPSKSNIKSRPRPTIRKVAECWNMVGLVGWWRRIEKETERQMKDSEREIRKSYVRKSQTSAKLSFIKKFFPDTEDKLEPDVDTVPQLKSKPDIILSTPSRDRDMDVAILIETGSKRKGEYLEERKFKKQKVSPSIAKKLLFFEGKCNMQENEPGTAQCTLLGCSDLAGQVSDSTAGRQQGYGKVKVGDSRG